MSILVLSLKVLVLAFAVIGVIVGALVAAGVWKNPLVLGWSHFFIIGFVIGQIMKVIGTPILTMPLVVAINRAVVCEKKMDRRYFSHFKDSAALKTALVLFLIGLADMLFNLVDRFVDIDDSAAFDIVMFQLVMVIAIFPLTVYLFGNLTYFIPATAVGKSFEGLKGLFIPFKGKVWLVFKLFLWYVLVILGVCGVIAFIVGVFYLIFGTAGWSAFKGNKIAQGIVYGIVSVIAVVVVCALEALWWAMVASAYKFTTFDALKVRSTKK